MIKLFEDCQRKYRTNEPKTMSAHCTSEHSKQKETGMADGEGVKTVQDGVCTK